ncbi:MAG: AgmX/PglI C-terminal domain-containing protein [Bdellovibrionota bacterium]
MEKHLILEDLNGQVLRTFHWDKKPVQVIRRGDSKRLELVSSLEHLKKKKIKFENLGTISTSDLSNGPFFVGQMGHLRLVDSVGPVEIDVALAKENRKSWQLTLLLGAILVASVLFIANSTSQMSPRMEEELRQQVVKIMNRVRVVTPKVIQHSKIDTESVKKNIVNKSVSLKRMGALSVLGSLNSSKQRGGLNLNAANTTAGPGLGGTEGSGGVQTSLYAKGLTSAPLGAGGNIQGAGGYGTKGKGGGQAGYGKLSLTGATGATMLPLGQDAVATKGLDRDQIAAVIQKNSGQVRFCYEQGLQSDPQLNGRVAVDFVIGGNGFIKSAAVSNTTLNAKGIEDCILMRLKTWKFPLPDGGVDVKVEYPFVLRRAGQG